MVSPCSRNVIKIIVLSFFVIMVSAEGWIDAHATFYGDIQGHDTEQGACGYNVFEDGYGLQTAALSTALFDDGAKCGTCYQIMCVNSKWCKPDAGTIKVTATNFCPPTTGPAPWCNSPYRHFDLSQPMFLKIAEYKGGIVPVKYRQINCVRHGGLKFQVMGNPYFLLVLVYNVGGVGDITAMNIMDSNRNWVPMSRNWGMNWQANGGPWVGQRLSFQVTISDGRTLDFLNVAPSNWQFGQSFEGHANF